MIADDELPIREWLRFTLTKCAPEAELVGVAANGGEALDCFREMAPQLVLTDIKMPILSGIELLREIKSTDPSVYVVMLTSHNDFEYARNALTYGADEYILKNEITAEILGKIIKTCRTRQNGRIAKASACAQPVHTEFRSPNELTQLLQVLSVLAPVNSYFVICVPFSEGARGEIQATAQEIARRYGQLTVEYHACGGLLFCAAVFPDIPSKLFQMNLYHSFATDLLHACAHAIGSSGIRTGGTYRDSALRAALSLNAAYYEEAETPKLFTLEMSLKNGLGEVLDPLCRKAISAVLQRDFENAGQLIEELMQQIGTRKPLDIPAVKQAASDILSGYRTVSVGSGMDLLEQASIRTAAAIEEAPTFSALRKAVGTFLADSSLGILRTQAGYSTYIQEAVAEVQKNYAHIQKVSDVADKLGLNMEYFCRLFKNETGTTFVTYLTDYRLKTAENLLKNTDMKVSEIAGVVGYDNLSYFSRLFKKKIGSNPFAYRATSGQNPQETESQKT